MGFDPVQIEIVLVLYRCAHTTQSRVSVTVVGGCPPLPAPMLAFHSGLLSGHALALCLFVSFISGSLLEKPVNTHPGSSMELL